MVKYFLLILILAIIPIYAGTIDPNTPDDKYIEYSKNFSSIGKISGKGKDNLIYFASGVAIDSHHILTAAHVVESCKDCFFHINDKKYCVYKIVYSKNYNTGFGIGDIAIGFIKEDIGLDNYPDLYTEGDEIGKKCSISGFGMTGTFETGVVLGDSKQRAGQNIIDYIDKELLVCSPSRGEDKTNLEFLIASGDSGGGLFIKDKLAGINSCIFVTKGIPNAKYGCEAGHTRISKYVEWIRRTIKEETPQ